MKILVTGGTGLIGAACVKRLIAEGHTVRALSRSDASADKLAALGATPVRGSIIDTSLLEAEARDADAIVYCAYDHASPDVMTKEADHEASAMEAICQGLEGSNKLLLYCSGVGWFKPDDNADEFTPLNPWFRSAADKVTEKWASRGVRPVQLRVGVVVHDHTFPHLFVQQLYQTDHVTYAKDGSNRWPAVHADDVALLVAKILAHESAVPNGRVSSVHVYAEQVSTKDLAEAIAQHTGLPIKPLGDKDLDEKGFFLGHVLTASPGIRNSWTRETFGWEPKANTVVEDMKKGGWFLEKCGSG